MTNVARRFAPFDGLRAVSIALVIVEHGTYNLRMRLQTGYVPSALAAGKLGVIMFFVISGVLITELLLKDLEKNGSISWVAFFARRAVRLYPVLYCYFVVIVLLNARGAIANSKLELVAAACFWWNYLPPGVRTPSHWYFGHFWSLALEQQFYLIWPAVLALAGRRRAVLVCLGVVALMPISRVATYLYVPAARGMIGMMFHTMADAVATGCLIALLRDRIVAAARQIGRAVLYCGLGMLLFAVFIAPSFFARWRGAYDLPIGISLDVVAAALLVVAVIAFPESRPVQLLGNPLAVHIGLISYSIYVWQQLFAGASFIPERWGQTFGFLLLLVVAEASYWLLERPAHVHGKRLVAAFAREHHRAFPRQIEVAREIGNSR